MSGTLEEMESCFALEFEALVAKLGHRDWRIRYTAAVALGDRGEPASVPALVRALEAEDKEPLYSQKAEFGGAHAGSNRPGGIKFPDGVAEGTLECWRRRGRVKQALCLALGQMGAAAAPALPLLHRYAVSQEEDYQVRAAACKALGQIGDAASVPALEKASSDPEWCSKTEAARSLKTVMRNLPKSQVGRGVPGSPA